MSGTVLRLGILKVPPYINFVKENGLVKMENVVGPYAMIHHIMAEKMNLSTHFMEPADNTFGVQKPNGSWTGLIGMLLRNEIDVIANPMAVTSNRHEVVKYTSPVSAQSIGVLAGNNPNEAISIFGYLGVFTLNLWIAVLLTMFILAMIGVAFDSLLNEKPKALGFRVIDSLSNYFGALFLEASPRDFSHDAGRLLFAFWWLGILVLMNAFQGHFKSSMMLQGDKDRIDTIKDVVNRPHLKPVIWRGSAYEDMFKQSTNPDIINLVKTVTKKNGMQFTKEIYSRETVEEVHRSTTVIVNEVIITKTYVSHHCQPQMGSLYFSREVIFPHFFAIATRPGLSDSVCNKMENIIYRVKESGLFDKILNEMLRDWTKCTRERAEDHSERSLKLKDLAAVFIFVPMGMCLAGISFLVEIFCHRRNILGNILLEK